MSKLLSLSILMFWFMASPSEAKEDLTICQSYEFHGQLSKQLEDDPVLATTAETGLEVELAVQAKGDLSLDLISLKGRDVMAHGMIMEKLASRKYLFELESIILDKPHGLGAGVGNIRAKKINSKTKQKCPPPLRRRSDSLGGT